MLAIPGTKISDIKKVYSHSQALSQCSNFIKKHNLIENVRADTAGSAERVSKNKDKKDAAIASTLSAETYGLEIIKKNIENEKGNLTRFLIMGKNILQPDGSEFICLSSGDEYYVRLHDKDNYTIIQNDNDGFYYYAKLSNDKLVPSEYKVNVHNPILTQLKPGLQISKQEYLSRKKIKDQIRGRDAPTIGTINNINIFIRFSDVFFDAVQPKQM